jgi:hypothetical protein
MLQQLDMSGMSCKSQIENIIHHQGDSNNWNRMVADPGLDLIGLQLNIFISGWTKCGESLRHRPFEE